MVDVEKLARKRNVTLNSIKSIVSMNEEKLQNVKKK